MGPDPDISGMNLFAALFSDEPMPGVEAAIVMAHPGDESVSASWLMVCLHERASVYCLTRASHGCPGGVIETCARHGVRVAANATIASAALAGVPKGRCHTFGLRESEFARDLASLVWLIAAVVTALGITCPANQSPSTFRCEAREVVTTLTSAVLMSPSRASC